MFPKKAKNFSTPYSRVVPHHSTDGAVTSLTLEIGRDPVLSSAYGRSWLFINAQDYKRYYTPYLVKNFKFFAIELLTLTGLRAKWKRKKVWQLDNLDLYLWGEAKKKTKHELHSQLFWVLRIQLALQNLNKGYFWVSKAKIPGSLWQSGSFLSILDGAVQSHLATYLPVLASGRQLLCFLTNPRSLLQRVQKVDKE
jgi:hypothetical protein